MQNDEIEQAISTDPIAALTAIMRRLRDPESGCPWDLQQTMTSIIPHTIEETYEVAHAIMFESSDAICDELGDLLFQVIFYAQIGSEQGWFDFDDVSRAICDKLVRRHPHIFDNQCTLTADEVEAQWAMIKAQEKQGLEQGVLGNIPTGLTPLRRAYKIQKACAKVGFDWDDIAPVLAKVREEINEVEAEIEQQSHAAIEEEIGDLLFAVVNLARHCNVDSEKALSHANHKFLLRFNKVEALCNERDISLSNSSLATLDAIWDEVKQSEK